MSGTFAAVAAYYPSDSLPLGILAQDGPVYAKEWMFRVHLSPFFGGMGLDQIGPAEIEAYKAKKLEEMLDRKSINNHLTALRKLLNLAAEWGALERAPKVRGFNVKQEFVSEDEYLSFDEADRLIRAAAPEWRALLVVALKTVSASASCSR
jgi:hypothetical protein